MHFLKPELATRPERAAKLKTRTQSGTADLTYDDAWPVLIVEVASALNVVAGGGFEPPTFGL